MGKKDVKEEKVCECEECKCENACECHEEDNCECSECDCKDDLQTKIKELEEKNLRTQAELINYRRRKEEEISKMLKYANEDIVKDLLPIVDNFERAISVTSSSEETEKFLEGFKMIYANLVKSLEEVEVKAIDGKNKPFDPTYHQAVMTEHVDDLDQGMVIEVLQKGYLLKDKVIRPAMVKVSE